MAPSGYGDVANVDDPRIEGLRLGDVVGHVHNRGAARPQQRGKILEHALVERGIDRARLEGWGCGETHPTSTNRTEEGRQANRRVEFHILEPAPPSGARTLDGCTASD